MKLDLKRYSLCELIKRIIGSLLYKSMLPLYRRYIVLRYKPDPHQILFMSQPPFSDNSKALYEYLLETEKETRFIWLVSDEDDVPTTSYDRTSWVVMRTIWHKGPPLKALRCIVQSGYVFFTHASPAKYVLPAHDRLVVNLWHGCGYKDNGRQPISFISQEPFDYALVPGKLFIDTKELFWGCRKDQILPIGYPRYDILLRENTEAKEYATSLKPNKDDKLVIWMPTFRKTTNSHLIESQVVEDGFDLPLVGSSEGLSRLDAFAVQNGITILIKRHPYQINYRCEKNKYKKIVFIDNTDLKDHSIDLYSLLRETDALISDYSSVAFDYLLLNKPIAFSLDDFEDYKKRRGFVFDDPRIYMPGHLLYSIENLFEFLFDIVHNNDPFFQDRMKVTQLAHQPTENYCVRIWDVIQRIREDRLSI